jgi:GNAT superfamily N-acetyltransferase
METFITPAALHDIGAILRWMEEFYAIDGYPFHAERTRAALTEFIADKDLGTVWIISSGSVPIGYAVLAVVYSFEFGGKNAFIDEFYLQPEYRGKGIGRTVLEMIVQKAKDSGIHALHLEAELHNERALQLYRSHHFADHHRILMTRYID